MKPLVSLFIIPAIVFAVSFTDNFESYTPGDDLDNSPYWVRADTSDCLVVINDGGNNVVETVWTDRSGISYICPGSGIWSVGTVGIDFEYTGSDAILGLIARGNRATSECYMAGVFTLPSKAAYSMILYVNSLGKHTVLNMGYISTLSENTWYSLSFEISGTDPVSLTLNLDGSPYSTCKDSTYLLSPGWSGLGIGKENAPPTFRLDNFHVDDGATTLRACTFAGIKALFQ
jgi:hypothetical protein